MLISKIFLKKKKKYLVISINNCKFANNLLANYKMWNIVPQISQALLDQEKEIKRDKNASIIYRGEDNSY